jgi:hypothetical protein
MEKIIVRSASERTKKFKDEKEIEKKRAQHEELVIMAVNRFMDDPLQKEVTFEIRSLHAQYCPEKSFFLDLQQKMEPEEYVFDFRDCTETTGKSFVVITDPKK